MNRRYNSAVFAAFLLLGCGAPQTSATDDGGATQTRQRITNITLMDLAVCFPKPPEVSGAVNKEVLLGLLVAARPQAMECFVDPKNRGAGKETHAVVKTSINGGKIETSVTGENLTPEGQKCVQGAIDKWLGGVPDLAAKVPAGSPAVTAEVPFQHVSGVSPTVELGLNEGSDITGTVRLAQATWCDCYADWKDAPPRALKAKVRILKRGGTSATPAEVMIDPTNDAVADRVGACLQKKVMAQTFTVSSDELTLPYSFLFTNASHAGPLASSKTADLQFGQLEALRGQQAAATVIAAGIRTSAATTYDALVQQYKAKQDPSLVDELKAKCADLLKTDDGYIAAVERQLEAEQKTLALVTKLTAKDAGWSKAAERAKSEVETTQKELESAKKQKADDTGICPKERF